MELAAYFDRIGYSGPRTPDLATLNAVMRAHVAAIPFENIDVQMGVRSTTALPGIFDKLVTRRRGGWCYENNGLFGWALGELGFDVRRVSGGVMRVARGDAALGNHLTLIVTVDETPYLVDVGFGGALAEPVALVEATRNHAPFAISLTKQPGGYWRFEERYGTAEPFSYDFLSDSADEDRFSRQCLTQQTDAASVFVQNLVVQQRQGDRHVSLRGRVLLERWAGGQSKRRLEDEQQFVTMLRDRFGLEVPGVERLWPGVVARDAELFPDEAAEAVA
jgi:N-hydroxyarylamine O-acetyltransferase